MFRVEVAEVEKAGCRSAKIGVVVAINILEIFAIILLVDRSINILVSKELEDKW